jgi:predicted transcriptional regulator
MVLVRQVMESDVSWVLRDQTIAQAAALFAEKNISGAPVCDGTGRVLGMLTKTDIAECAAAHDTARLVEEAMTCEVISLGADEPLERAIHVMAFEGVHRLIVLDSDRHLVGIITSMDILRDLAGFGRRSTRQEIAVAPPKRD